MKRLLSLTLLLPFLASAAPVSPEEAAELVKGYAAYTGGELLDGRVAVPAGDPRPVSAEIDGEEVVLAWAFGMEPRGWIIVGADDRLPPVVGFSAEGELGDAFWDPVSPPYHFVRGTLLDEWEAAIGPVEPVAPTASDGDSASDGGEDGRSAVADANGRAWSKYLAASVVPEADDGGDPPLPTSPPSSVADLRVDALLGDIKWSQSGSGENYYTPHNFVCGCVQTALGQIMYYHRWPQAGIGRITRTIRVSYDGSVTVQSATTRGGDGNGGPYRWDLMTPGYAWSGGNEAQAQARGALLYDLGVLNSATYGASGTSAFQTPVVITRDLKYANAVDGGIGIGRIEDALCCNFDARCPVSAASSSHQVVFDGYGFEDGELYFHVNFGWGGSSDGWYLKENWRGHSLGSFVYNIFPEKTGEIVSGRVLNPDGTPLAGAVVSVAKADGGAVIGTATSGDRGVWAYVGVPSGTAVKVTASYSGRSFDTVDVDVGTSHYNAGDVSDRDCGNRWGVDLVAYDAGKGNVRGFVRTRTGLPVPGLVLETGDGRYRATTDADGLFFFSVAAGWSGTLAPASGQGALAATPARHEIPALAAGAFAVCDFTVSSRIYVKADAAGANDGSSWADARTSLPDALAEAGNDFEVWVAEGTYKPTTGTSRGVPFSIPANVKVYGGFSGTEAELGERNWLAHPTVLSGEIGNAASASDNSAVLVRGAPGALLDGFAITGAYSGASESASAFGLASGAFAVVSSAPANASAYDPYDFVVQHCRITGNTHACPIVSGGAVLRSCVVDNNACLGAVFARGGMFSFCTVVRNSGKAFNANETDAYGLPARFFNSYFRDSSFTDSKAFIYYNFHTSSYNVHDTADRSKVSDSISGTGPMILYTSEAYSTDPLSYGMPPTNSPVLNRSMISSFSGQTWTRDAAATDFAGRPRLLGTAPDAGAWELPVPIDTTPVAAIAMESVGEDSAVVAWEFYGVSGSSSATALKLSCGTHPDRYYSPYGVLNGQLIGSYSAAASGTYPLSGLERDTVYYVLLQVNGQSLPVLSFRTGFGSAPFVASLAVTAVGSDCATVRVPLTSVGSGSSGAIVRLQTSRTSDFATILDDREVAFDAPGEKDVAISGLSPDTTYFVRAYALASNGLSYTTDAVDFTTEWVPFSVPVLATLEDDGHVPLAFGKDASNNPTFELTIKNAVKDAWYTVYAADTVDGAYRAVTSEKATLDGLKTLAIPAPDSKPTRFVRIGVSDAQIPENTEL